MSDSDFNFQAIVLPKGFEGDMLRVTIVIAPQSRPQVHLFNLPEQLQSLVDIALRGKAKDCADYELARINFSTDQRAMLRSDLWKLVFDKADESYSPKPSGEKTLAARFRSKQAVQTLHVLTASAMAHLNVASSVPRDALSESEVVRPGVRVAMLAHVGRQNRATGAAPQAWSAALHDIDGLFRRPGDHVDDLIDDLGQGNKQKWEASDWLRLLASYEDDETFAKNEAAERPVPKVVRALRPLGLRNRDGVLAQLQRRMKTATESLVDAGKPAIDRFADLVLDSLLLTAPHAIRTKSKRVHPDKEQASDALDPQNLLAAVGMEFGLHPLLGLTLDLKFSAAPGSKLAHHLTCDDAFLSVDLGRKDAACAWTAVTPSGTPRPYERAGQTDVVSFRPDGWCSIKGGALANLEGAGNVAKWKGALIDSRNRAQVLVRGIAGASQEALLPRLQTGPVVLHVDGLADWRVKGLDAAGVNPGQASDATTGPDFYLQDLVIGIRPTLRVTGSDQRSAEAALLDREITYSFSNQVWNELAAASNVDPTRSEGLVPLIRMSSPGEKTDGTADTLVADEQLFEWNGWNSAVPFPGTQPPQKNPDVVPKQIQAKPGSNVPYRYGTTLRAACRWVLRDGSSLIQATANVVGSTPPDPTVPWVSAGLTLDGSLADGLPVRRYEPLRAPVLLLADEFAASSLNDDQATGKVLLGGLHDRPPVCESTVRYVLPGAIRDAVELGRHGVFDHGVKPSATAFAAHARAPASAPDDQIFPSVPRAGGCSEPVFRLSPTLGLVKPARVYHPDPLAKRLLIGLVRRTKVGAWRAVVDEQGLPITHVVDLYDGDRSWPNARALKLTFEARRRGDRRATIKSGLHLEGIHSVDIGVPEGERYFVMLLPEGDGDEMKRKHAVFALSPQAESPLVAEMSVVEVEYVLDRPLDPVIRRISPVDRALAARECEVDLQFAADAGSVTQVDLHAAWTDPVDDPQQATPRDDSSSARSRSAMLVRTLGSAFDTAVDAAVATTKGNRPERALVDVSPPRFPHEFPDTRRRLVWYRLRAAGNGLLHERGLVGGGEDSHADSEPHLVDVKASAPPLAPSIREILPAFKFMRFERLMQGESARVCALSVILERGWWSSGPGELLAVLVSKDSENSKMDLSQPVGSSWGTDPLRKSERKGLKPFMTTADFAQSDHRRPTDDVVDVARDELVLYEPRFDKALNAWRVDIVLNADGLAQPFIQFVLARFQPHAVPSAQLSATVVADFVQLPSNRYATVTLLGTTGEMTITVSGTVGVSDADAGLPNLAAYIQTAWTAGVGAHTWKDAGFSIPLKSVDADHFVGQTVLPPELRRGQIRVRIEERTLFKNDDVGSVCTLGPMQYFDFVGITQFDREIYVGGRS